MARTRDGRTAAIADRDLDGARVDCPGHLEPFARQRVSMQDRVAEQLADHKRRVRYRVVENPGRPQILGERLTRQRDARRSTRQVDDARRPHLPDRRPPAITASYFSAPHGSDARTYCVGNRLKTRR
jgi:hypothetical protein